MTIIVHIIIVHAYASLMDICAVKVLDRMYILRLIQLTSHLDTIILLPIFKGVYIFLLWNSIKFIKKLKTIRGFPLILYLDQSTLNICCICCIHIHLQSSLSAQMPRYILQPRVCMSRLCVSRLLCYILCS